MTRPFKTRDLQFYLTAPSPCAYLPGRRERKVFTHLRGQDAAHLNEALAHAGFRRSQSLVYRPACETCDACLSARVRVADFTPTRSQKRVLKRNADVVSAIRPNAATQEQFGLLSRYLESRHADGGMAGLSFGEYAMMAGDTPCPTDLIEYRYGAEGPLAAALIADRLGDGYSLVYSFFDAEAQDRSLGTYIVLDQIARAAAAGLPFVYLGYWVRGSRKMAYKARFQPLEVLRHAGWTVLGPEDAADG